MSWISNKFKGIFEVSHLVDVSHLPVVHCNAFFLAALCKIVTSSSIAKDGNTPKIVNVFPINPFLDNIAG